MHFHLIVSSPFGDFAAGDLVTDADVVDGLLQSHPDRVLKVAPLKPPALPGNPPKED